MARVLIIDDDEIMCDMLSRMVQQLGHETACAHTLAQGQEGIATREFDVVLLDVHLPDGNGLDIVPVISKAPSAPEIIIITAEGDPDGAELAIKNGAWDYIEKPSSVEKMTLPIVRALQYRNEKRSQKHPVALKRDAIVGSSNQIKKCFDLVAQAAVSDAPALLLGETGTGKELFASAIHDNSERRKKNFVVVDCAALPETLVESSLFGYRRGAFTGADRDMEGLIKQADGGTLFLDEIGELSLNLQKAFLRVLQEHRFRPLGSQSEIASNFRVVAASNRNLKELAKKGSFRRDLLFRLESIVIELPPLRERQDDIKELAMHFVAKLCSRYGVETKGFAADFFEVLSTYTWPGNVREFINTIEWTLSSAPNDPTLYARHLPPHIRIHLARASVSKKESEYGMLTTIMKSKDSLKKLNAFREEVLEKAESLYLKELLNQSSSDMKKACSISGLSRTRLYALLKKYKLSLKKKTG